MTHMHSGSVRYASPEPSSSESYSFSEDDSADSNTSSSTDSSSESCVYRLLFRNRMDKVINELNSQFTDSDSDDSDSFVSAEQTNQSNHSSEMPTISSWNNIEDDFIVMSVVRIVLERSDGQLRIFLQFEVGY